VKVSGERRLTLDAPPHQVLAMLVDFAAYPQWWPGCLRADVVGGEAPSRYDVALTFDTHTPIGKIEVTIRFDVSSDGRSVRLSSLAGPLEDLEGDGWTLTPGPDGTTTDARYELSGEMKTGLPAFVERPFAGKANEFLIDGPVVALQSRIASGVR
jgi:ribosome-associated toxin RatA of RatAB toxin-antitoxin module